MDFCPSCGKKLIRQKKTEGKKVVLLLSCPKCGYIKRATRPITTVLKILNYSSQERIVVLGKGEQKLRTFPTIRIKCSRCENNLAYVWMVQVRKLDESSTQFFRCTRCSYTFREDS